jgi:hypothetical protein
MSCCAFLVLVTNACLSGVKLHTRCNVKRHHNLWKITCFCVYKLQKNWYVFYFRISVATLSRYKCTQIHSWVDKLRHLLWNGGSIFTKDYSALTLGFLERKVAKNKIVPTMVVLAVHPSCWSFWSHYGSEKCNSRKTKTQDEMVM